jgi:signal transduction histidine kinase
VFNSVRVRLALWNLLVFTLVMVGAGLLLRTQLKANLEDWLDQEMVARARPLLGPKPIPSRLLPSLARERDRSRERDERGGSSVEMAPPIYDANGRNLLNNTVAPDPEAVRDAAREGTPRFTTRTLAPSPGEPAEPFRVYTVPVRENGALVAVVQNAVRLTPLREEVDNVTRTLLTILPAALLLVMIGAAFLTDRALRPVRAVTDAAAAIQASDLSRRLDVAGRDEFARLAGTLNAMLARLEESFARQKRFVADASHELRTPLTVIKANTGLALADPDLSDDQRESLTEIDRAADRTIRLVSDLLVLARADGGGLRLEREAIPARELLEEAERECRRVRVGPKGMTFTGDRHHLLRLLVNLLDNALRHTPADGRVVLSASLSAGEVILETRDTGVGIPPEHLAHLGERFYRADPSRSRGKGGTGLGLAICRSIAEAHGGTLTIHSRPGAGTTVLVRILG